MNTIEQLKAEVAEVTKQAIEAAKEAAQVNALAARLALVQSEPFKQALTREAEQTAKLEAMNSYISLCKEVVVMNPVRDTVLRKDKQWNGRPTYGLGKDIELLHTLCTGILYSVAQHKDVMLAITKVNLDTIERFLNALGRTPYYSDRYECVVDALPYDTEEAKQTATLLATQLGVTLDTSKLTEATFALRATTDALKAEEAAKEVLNTPPNMSFTME